MLILTKFYLVLVLCQLYVISILSQQTGPIVRDKRTLDFLLRSFADTVGYDVLKRPTTITTTRPPPTMAARPAPPAPPAPPTPPAPPAPPMRPAVTLMPPLPAKPAVTLMPPARPAATSAPGNLIQSLSKNFSLNFLWNKNIGPAPAAPAPNAPAPPAPPAPAPPPPPPPMPINPSPPPPPTKKFPNQSPYNSDEDLFCCNPKAQYNDEASGELYQNSEEESPDNYQNYHDPDDNDDGSSKNYINILNGPVQTFWKNSPYLRHQEFKTVSPTSSMSSSQSWGFPQNSLNQDYLPSPYETGPEKYSFFDGPKFEKLVQPNRDVEEIDENVDENRRTKNPSKLIQTQHTPNGQSYTIDSGLVEYISPNGSPENLDQNLHEEQETHQKLHHVPYVPDVRFSASKKQKKKAPGPKKNNLSQFSFDSLPDYGHNGYTPEQSGLDYYNHESFLHKDPENSDVLSPNAKVVTDGYHKSLESVKVSRIRPVSYHYNF